MNNYEITPEIIHQIKEFCLMDDIFMTMFFDGQNHLMELVLKIILKTDDLKVQQTKTQFEIHSIGGRSARLDVLAIDSEGKHYNFEIQNADDGAIPKRARFNSAMLDATLLKKSDKYSDLPETYVIFFTKKDVLKWNLPIYNIERIITQNQQNFGDGEHIIYVNGSYEADDALGKLVQDFQCRDPKEMNYNELAGRAKYLKYEEGATQMSDALTEFILKEAAKVEAKAIEKTRSEERITFATRLLRSYSMSNSEISLMTDLSLDEVEKLSKEIRKSEVAN